MLGLEFIALPLLLAATLGFLLVDGDSAKDEDDVTEHRFGAGDDSATGTAGSDLIWLGDGSDRATGGTGDDRIFGGADDDDVSGGPGNDRIFLGQGQDQNFAGATPSSNDVRGDDLVRGGAGDDQIVDFLGTNEIYGDIGDDLINLIDRDGEPESADQLFGGFGNDNLAFDNGDFATGGAGVDSFFVVLNAGPVEPAVITDYEPGEALYVSVPLAFEGQEAVLEPDAEGLRLRLGETVLLQLRGISDPDEVTLYFGAADIADQTVVPGDLRLGTQGDDRISTGNDDDAVFAGRGDDLISTGAGDDYISLRSARPFADEGSLGWGKNAVNAGSGDDRVVGGLGDDQVFGAGGSDLLIGGGGADHLAGGGGDDLLDGRDSQSGNPDRIFGGNGDDRLLLDDGDTATGGAGRDFFEASTFDKTGAPVTITDYEPGRDTLNAAVSSKNLAIRYVAVGDDTHVLVGGRLIFVLENLRPDDIDPADLTVRRYA